MDVNLTIQAYPGEQPWISGAVELKPTWTAMPPNPSKPVTWQTYVGVNDVFALNFSLPPIKVCIILTAGVNTHPHPRI